MLITEIVNRDSIDAGLLKSIQTNFSTDNQEDIELIWTGTIEKEWGGKALDATFAIVKAPLFVYPGIKESKFISFVQNSKDFWHKIAVGNTVTQVLVSSLRDTMKYLNKMHQLFVADKDNFDVVFAEMLNNKNLAVYLSLIGIVPELADLKKWIEDNYPNLDTWLEFAK